MECYNTYWPVFSDPNTIFAAQFLIHTIDKHNKAASVPILDLRKTSKIMAALRASVSLGLVEEGCNEHPRPCVMTPQHS